METFCLSLVTAGRFKAWGSTQVLHIAAIQQISLISIIIIIWLIMSGEVTCLLTLRIITNSEERSEKPKWKAYCPVTAVATK
jgi:hypothetical protein